MNTGRHSTRTKRPLKFTISEGRDDAWVTLEDHDRYDRVLVEVDDITCVVALHSARRGRYPRSYVGQETMDDGLHIGDGKLAMSVANTHIVRDASFQYVCIDEIGNA